MSDKRSDDDGGVSRSRSAGDEEAIKVTAYRDLSSFVFTSHTQEARNVSPLAKGQLRPTGHSTYKLAASHVIVRRLSYDDIHRGRCRAFSSSHARRRRHMLAQPKLVLGDGPDEMPTVQPPGRVVVTGSLAEESPNRATGSQLDHAGCMLGCDRADLSIRSVSRGLSQEEGRARGFAILIHHGLSVSVRRRRRERNQKTWCDARGERLCFFQERHGAQWVSAHGVAGEERLRKSLGIKRCVPPPFQRGDASI